jgi:DNA-binding transcriptional ArsR family regulator
MTTTVDRMTPRSDEQERRTDATKEGHVTQTSNAAPERLSLLDDEYTREVLIALSSGPQRGRDLETVCDASRPTVYRRVNRLEEAGLVKAEMTVDPDGHHCKKFRLVRDRLTVAIEDGTITVTARPSTTERAI